MLTGLIKILALTLTFCFFRLKSYALIPQFYKIIPYPATTINVLLHKKHHFFNPFHFHPELELTLILKSTGIRFVGDSVEAFEEGNLVLIGANIPHCWRNHTLSIEDDTHKAEMLTVHFDKNFIGEAFYNLPECTLINALLSKAMHGVKITGTTRNQLARLLITLQKQEGISRIITLLTILKHLSLSLDIIPSASTGFVTTYKDSERINRVLLYVINNISNIISLKDVALETSMSETGFCRYFKVTTGKTFSTFLNEFRVAYACKLLISSSESITQIAYESGYNNLSNFLIQFKRVMQMTPRKYQAQFKRL